MAGSLAKTGSQLLILVVIGRVSGIEDVGRYAFCLAVTAPIFTFFEFGLRNIFVSIERSYPFVHYVAIRAAGVSLGMCISLLVGLTQNAAPLTVLLAIALVKAIDSAADIFAARLQRVRGLLYIGLAGVVNGLVTLAAMFVVIELTGNLTFAVVASAAVSVAANALVLGIGWRRLVSPDGVAADPSTLGFTLRSVLPAGIAYGSAVSVASLTAGLPLYLLAHTSTAATIGGFAPLMYFLTGANLLFNSLAQSVLPRWTATLATSGATQLRRDVLRTLLVSVICAAVLAVAIALVGSAAVEAVFGSRADSGRAVCGLIAIAVLTSPLVCVAGAGTLVLNKYGPQLVFNLATLVVAGALGFLLIPNHGVVGAAGVVGATGLVRGLCALFYFLRTSSRRLVVERARQASAGMQESLT